MLARNREISIADTIRHLKDGIVDGRIADRDPALLAHAIHGVVAELTRHYRYVVIDVGPEVLGTDVAAANHRAVLACAQQVLLVSAADLVGL